MSIVLYHHPFSRAATVIWMLEELGLPYTLHPIDIRAGEQKSPELLALNPMGKLPVLQDGDQIVTETAAIGLYLADRYAPGRLAPAMDDPSRGTYLRWAFFAPSVIEPGCMAKAAGWTYRSGSAGWGDYEPMLTAMEAALDPGPYLLGERFTMVDCVFGSTLRWMLGFKMIEARPSFVAYAERLAQRPALIAANARNKSIVEALGLTR